MHRTMKRATLVPGVLVTGIALVLTMWSPSNAAAATYRRPAGLTVVSTTTTSANLDWRKVSGASGYRVRYGLSSTMASAKSASFRYSKGTVAGLKPGTKYWFRVAVAAHHGTGARQSPFNRSPYPSGTTRTSTPPPPPPPPPPYPGSSADLHVASFNLSGILNDSDPSRPEHKPWATRRTVVSQQLLGQNPSAQAGDPADVIALQEANTSKKFSDGVTTQYTDLVNALNSNATGHDHYTAVDPRLALNATRIAYNDDTLSLVKAGAFKWTAQEYTDGERMMAWGIFQVKSTGARFFFASNHLESASASVRQNQWDQLLVKVPELAGGLPVVLGGDFNVPSGQTGSMLTQMKQAGFGDALGLTSSAAVFLKDRRARRVVNGNFFTLNRFSRPLDSWPDPERLGGSIDYVFATNALVVQDWEIVLDDVTNASTGNSALQGVIPSDHNMVRSVIVLPGS